MPIDIKQNNAQDQATTLKNRYDGDMSPILGKIKKLAVMLVKAAMIAFLLVGIMTYVYFCPPVLTSANGGFILFPMPAGEEYKYETINGVKREEVYFSNKAGNKLNGWFFQSPNAVAPVVLINHGNAGNLGHRLLLVMHLMNAGASVFVYDYREFGKSEGKKSLAGLIDDSEAAYNYLTKDRKIPDSKVIVYGESIGGGPTCVLAEKHPVAAIILDSTFTTLLHVGKKKISAFNIYPDFLKPIPAFENIEELKGKHAPLLIIHGQQDQTIPLSEGQENFAAASQPKTMLVLPHSTHNSKDADFDLYESGVKKFLESLKEQSHA